MANAIYPLYKQNILAGTSGYDLDNDTVNDGPYVNLVDTGTYTYSASHNFFSELSGLNANGMRITTPTVTTGTFDGDNITFSSVAGTVSYEGFIIYRHNAGANTTWPLVLYYDASGGGLPVTSNGGDITITWNGSGIFLISDQRAKENIRQVGKVGPFAEYEYNYRGSQHRHRGFMAQEVEQILPAAVMDCGRFKAVNYDAAMRLAA